MNYEETLASMMETNPRLMVMTAENRAAIRNLESMRPDRFVDVGIAEQTMIGSAAGFASRGRVPVVHALSTFLTLRAFEFVRTDVGIAQLPVKLVGCVPGFLSSANGPTHQAIDDIGVMRMIPSMEVFCPGNKAELLAALPAIIERDAPCYIRYFDEENDLILTTEVPNENNMPAPVMLREEKDASIIALSYGMMTKHAAEAADKLAAAGNPISLMHVPTIEPLDTNAIFEAAKAHETIVVIEDHFKRGGLYSALSEAFIDARINTRLISISLEHNFFVPALLNDVLAHEGFDAEGLKTRIEKIQAGA